MQACLRDLYLDELVASVIEDSGSTLSGVDSVNSYSFENYCMVLFTYEYGVDIDECHNDLRAAMETAKLSLPYRRGSSSACSCPRRFHRQAPAPRPREA